MDNERLQSMTQDAKDIAAKIAVAEENLKLLKAAYRERTEQDIPALMQELGIESCTLADGTSVSIKENIFASITEARQEAAFSWLRGHGLGGIIKEVTSTSVHPQTLKAQMKELLERGDDVPLELFGIYRATVAKIG